MRIKVANPSEGSRNGPVRDGRRMGSASRVPRTMVVIQIPCGPFDFYSAASAEFTSVRRGSRSLSLSSARRQCNQEIVNRDFEGIQPRGSYHVAKPEPWPDASAANLKF